MSRKCWIDCIGPISPADSRWPLRLYLLGLVLAWTAVLASGLPGWAKVLLLPASIAVCRREWRCRARIERLQFSPEVISGRLHAGPSFSCQPPFQCMVTLTLVSFRTDQGWLQVWADQLDADTFRRLRRVLWLHRG